jgi:NADH dehydrogenase
MIVIIGAGALGNAVARRLLAQGKAVRILARNPAKAQSLVDQGAEVMQGDLLDAASLRRACKGADAVLASAHSILGRGRNASKFVDWQGHRDLIDAAKAAGVRRFVYTSVRGASADNPVPFWRYKFAVEQHLRASGLPYVILRPAAYMEDHVHALIGLPILEKGKVTLFGKGENPRNFVAADDVAQVAVKALADPSMVGQIVDVGGPENWTNMQVVRLYEQLAGRPVKVSHMPLGALRVLSALLRPLHPGLSQIMASGIWLDMTDQTYDMPPGTAPSTRLEDWVRARVVAVGRPVTPAAE